MRIEGVDPVGNQLAVGVRFIGITMLGIRGSEDVRITSVAYSDPGDKSFTKLLTSRIRTDKGGTYVVSDWIVDNGWSSGEFMKSDFLVWSEII